MVETLIAGKAVLVNIEDRTQVISLKEWNITDDDIVQVFDLGGLLCTIVAQFFISQDTLIFIVHNVTKIQPEYTDKTKAVMHHALHLYPTNKMCIIFTHTDLIDADQVAQNINFLSDALKQFFDDEISNLNKLLIQMRTDGRDPHAIDTTIELLECFKNKKSTLPVFCVSSQNYSGMAEVKDFLVTMAKTKRTDVPESWISFYKDIIETKKIYLTLEELSSLFQSITHEMHKSDHSVRNSGYEFPIALKYFTDTNLCVHYENNPFLKDYVFPDIDLLVDLFKSLFHQNIAAVINYDEDENLMAVFLKGEFDLALHRFWNEGLLAKKLLVQLWKKYGLSIHDETVLLHMMQSFNLCHSISTDEELLYFPWFVQAQECPPHIDRAHLMEFDQNHSSVHLQCEFFNRIPLNVFEMVSVCLQRKATQTYHYVVDRQAWHDGLELLFGSVRCVLTRSHNNSTIDICLYGEVDAIPEVWLVMESVFKDLDSILKPFVGVIKTFHFVCGHCVILGVLKPHHWLPDLVFPKKSARVPRYVTCPKDQSMKVPSALLIHVFQGKIAQITL